MNIDENNINNSDDDDRNIERYDDLYNIVMVIDDEDNDRI